MRFHKIMEVPVTNENYLPSIYSNGSWTIVTTQKGIDISSANKRYSLPILRVAAGCFSGNYAFLIDELGCIFKVDLPMQSYTVLGNGFDADSGLTVMHSGKLLACKTVQEFYSEAYLLDIITGTQTKVDTPPYTRQICGYDRELCFIVTGEPAREDVLNLQVQTSGNFQLLRLDLNDPFYPFAFHFQSRRFAVEKSGFFHNRIQFYDHSGSLHSELPLKHRVQQFHWICGGRAFVIEFVNGFQVRSYDSLEIIYEQHYKSGEFLELSSLSYDSKYFCVNAVRLIQLVCIE